MSLDTDIAKLQEQLELLKKQKEDKEKNKINLDGYLDNFETIEQIDNEINLLCNENLKYRKIKTYANILNLINEEIGNCRMGTYSLNKLDDVNILFNPNILDVLDKIKNIVINYPETKKLQNAGKYSKYHTDSLFGFEENIQYMSIFEIILRMISHVNSIKKSNNKQENMYMCYEYNNLSCFSFENKYKQLYKNNLSEEDTQKNLIELENDIAKITLYYYDAVIFIKTYIKIFNEYPENYEKNIQLKIIELHKKKYSLVLA